MKEGKVFLAQLKTLTKILGENRYSIWTSQIYFEEKGGYACIIVPFIKEGRLMEYTISGPDGGYIETEFEGVMSVELSN